MGGRAWDGLAAVAVQRLPEGGFDEKEERWSREAEPGWLLGGGGLGMRKRNRAVEQRKRI
jgi:hypothetical protein